MASIVTSQWAGGSSPQARFNVWQTGETGNTVTFGWSFEYVAHGYAAYTNGVARNYWGTIDGVSVVNQNYNINGVSSTVTLASGSYTVSKHNYYRNVPIACAFAFDISWSGYYAGSLSASGSISIPPKTSYSVTYNANGGSGAPGSQTKWYGDTLKLSSTKPTRTGYTFQGWSTSASGGVSYQPGANYTTNAGVTLYAVWKANTFTITYNANGGSGAPGSQTKTYGVTLKLSSTTPTKQNYNFLGWATSASSTTVSYQPGANYTDNTNLTLYAVWELGYQDPIIENLRINRCTSEGVLDDEGTFVKIEFDWAIDEKLSLSSSVKYTFTIANRSQMASFTPFFSHKGSRSFVITDIELSIEESYTYTFKFDDGSGITSPFTINGTIPAFAYTMDFLKGGKGVAFGKPAANEGFEVNMDAKFEKSLKDKFGTEIRNGAAAYGSIDPNTTLEHMILTNHSNRPSSTPAYWYIMTIFNTSKTSTAVRSQIAIPHNGDGSLYYRQYYNSVWTSWKRVVTTDKPSVSAMTVAFKAGDYNMTGYTALDLPLLIGDTSDGLLSQSGGGIKIGNGVTSVLVSATAFGYVNGGNAENYFWIGINRLRGTVNDRVLTGISLTYANTYASPTIPPAVIPVKAGDILKLYKNDKNTVGIRGNGNTFLTVQVLG